MWRSAPVDPAFIDAAWRWADEPDSPLLDAVWRGYEALCRDRPPLSLQDLERSITQRLAPRIQQVIDPFGPYFVIPEAFEHETMASPPAQPPAYDIAFVMLADERVMWPLEAKVLETSGRVAAYVADVQEQYLTCRYAPFSSSGGMLAYLLSDDAAGAFANIETKLGAELIPAAAPPRHQRYSRHTRTVPHGKAYPGSFVCHHLVLRFPGLKREAKTPNS